MIESNLIVADILIVLKDNKTGNIERVWCPVYLKGQEFMVPDEDNIDKYQQMAINDIYDRLLQQIEVEKNNFKGDDTYLILDPSKLALFDKIKTAIEKNKK